MKRTPQHNAKIGRAVSRSVIATHPETKDMIRFESGKQAALWCGRADAAANISRACRTGRTCNGFYWSKAAKRAKAG